MSVLQGSRGGQGESGIQGPPGEPGKQGPTGFPGPPGYCEQEVDIDGSGEYSGELETDWKGLTMPAHRNTSAGALKGVKGEKVGSKTEL